MDSLFVSVVLDFVDSFSNNLPDLGPVIQWKNYFGGGLSTKFMLPLLNSLISFNLSFNNQFTNVYFCSTG